MHTYVDIHISFFFHTIWSKFSDCLRHLHPRISFCLSRTLTSLSLALSYGEGKGKASGPIFFQKRTCGGRSEIGRHGHQSEHAAEIGRHAGQHARACSATYQITRRRISHQPPPSYPPSSGSQKGVRLGVRTGVALRGGKEFRIVRDSFAGWVRLLFSGLALFSSLQDRGPFDHGRLVTNYRQPYQSAHVGLYVLNFAFIRHI